MIKKIVFERKKILNNILRVFLFLIVTLILCFITYKIYKYSYAAEWYTLYTYETSGSKLILTKYNGTATTVTVPASTKISGTTYTTYIQGGVFRNNTDITKVVFEDGVRASSSIAYLFSGCSNLTTIELYGVLGYYWLHKYGLSI